MTGQPSTIADWAQGKSPRVPAELHSQTATEPGLPTCHTAAELDQLLRLLRAAGPASSRSGTADTRHP